MTAIEKEYAKDWEYARWVAFEVGWVITDLNRGWMSDLHLPWKPGWPLMSREWREWW